jgi:hypothetical protein
MACSCYHWRSDPVVVLADCANALYGAEIIIPDTNDNIVGGIKMKPFLYLILEHDEADSIV